MEIVMRNHFLSPRNYSNEIMHKVKVSLVTYVYEQTIIAMIASLVCASIIFAGLYTNQEDKTLLYVWSAFYLLVTGYRVILVMVFENQANTEKRIDLWSNLYLFGTVMAGICWGASSIFLLPDLNGIHKTLLVLMLAGVTAGSVPLSAPIPIASILFLTLTIIPYLIIMALMPSSLFLLFDVGLFIYLIYLIIVTINIYEQMKDSIVVKFENDSLLADLTEAKHQLEITNKRFEFAATHDPLTAVANRNLFEANLRRAIMLANQNNTMVALLYIDLDAIKQVNDLHGHHAGDFLLKSVATRMKDFLGMSENISRLGGDEFTVILENIHEFEDITKVAQQLCQLLAMPFKYENMEFKISASIGISVYPYHGLDVESLIHAADKTMYYVKEHGGNNFQFYKDLLEAGK